MARDCRDVPGSRSKFQERRRDLTRLRDVLNSVCHKVQPNRSKLSRRWRNLEGDRGDTTRSRPEPDRVCRRSATPRYNTSGNRHDTEQSWRKSPPSRRKMGSSCRNTKKGRTGLSRRRADLPGACDPPPKPSRVPSEKSDGSEEPPYSYRSASMGSREAARVAG